MSVEGHKAANGEDMQAFMNALTPGYFKAMHVPLLAGRDFEIRDQPARWDDDPDSGPRVAIVNRRFAEHFFKTVNVVGKHIGWGDGPETKLNIEIVGVVENQLYEGPREGVRRQVFVPRTGSGGIVYYVRSSIGSTTLYGQLRNEVRRIDNAHAGLRHEDAGAAARRDAAHRSPRRAARRPASACSPRPSRRSASTA